MLLSWLCFAKQRSRGSVYTLIAFTFVADKSNARQVYTVAAESPAWAQWHSVAVFPPLPLVLEIGLAGIFTGVSFNRHQTMFFMYVYA